MSHIFVEPKAELVELTFKNTDGNEFTVQMKVAEFLRAQGSATQVIQRAQSRIAAKSGHHEIRALRVVGALAKEAEAGTTVVAAFHIADNTLHHMAMSPAQATDLAKSLTAAAERANQQSKKTSRQ